MSRLPSRQNSITNTPSSPPAQWIMITEDKIVQADPNNENKIVMCKLRHPKADKSAMFLISDCGQRISEVKIFKDDFGSWLIGNSVQQDGSLLMTTPVDPVFLILPYLINACKNGKFMTLDQIVQDEEFPDCSRILHCSGLESLDQVSDVKGDEEYIAYRYNSDKTLAWLRMKVDNVTEALALSNIEVNDSGAQCVSFVRTKKNNVHNQDSNIKFAFGLVSDYLPLELSTSLKDYLRLKEVSTSENKIEEPSNKKLKLGDITPTEDYSTLNGKKMIKQTLKSGKQSAAQKKLSKVDKSGMKSISSFFSSKS